jgi:hypothetical protein
MVEGETSNPPSLADSPPRVETVNPGEELEEGIEEVPELAFPEGNESDIEPEDPNEYEDMISQGANRGYPGHPPTGGCRHAAF